MKIKFPTGTTAENNQLLLPEGMLSIDLERKALRLHDGVTQGGFEMVGERAYELPFRGEVSSSALISGDALASMIGMTAGVAQYSDVGWLHFVDPVDGKTKYIAKRSFRHSISWDHIHGVNAVYGGRTIEIQGQTYRVRLLRGASSDPAGSDTGWDTPSTHGSEWNRLIYHVHSGKHTTLNNTLTSEGISGGDWAQYSDSELGVHYTSANGARAWCQEVHTSGPGRRVTRGNNGVSNIYGTSSSTADQRSGWRPCLELVE